ncbi:MAG: hypothetical protein LC115_08025 [Bacteroidia bacterium]|nr:hypothetical protein [Bacteroidia bacterium]
MCASKDIQILIYCFLGVLLNNSVWGQASFSEKVTTAADIGMTINNLGMVGNAFKGSYVVLKYPSCEYPRNSGIEHLFEGGLWIGAKSNGGSIIVSTGAVDDASGYTTGKAGFEYTAAIGSELIERSSLLDNANYTPNAISHQDLVSDFTDTNIVVPGTSTPISTLENGPIGTGVHFEAYNWNYSFADFFVILNYQVTNVSTNTWNDAYLGLWIDPVVRNVNVTAAGSGGTAFYNKSGTGFMDSLLLGYEFDATGDIGFTESYIGTKFLGAESTTQFYHPKITPNFNAYFNSWNFKDFTSSYRAPQNDNERYAKLSSGLNTDPNWESTIKAQLKIPGNRSQLISVGPFSAIKPGETVTIAFAIVLAKKNEDGNPNITDNEVQKQLLAQNAAWAQSAYNGEDKNFNGILDEGEDLDGNGKITRYILPTPPDIPKTRWVVSENQVTLFWANNAENSIDPITQKKDFEGYRIYQTSTGFDVTNTQNLASALKLIAQFDMPDNQFGYNNGMQSVKLPQPQYFVGDSTAYQYRYTFLNLPAGWQQAMAITAFDQGDPESNLASLETSRLSPTAMKRIFPGKPANDNFIYGDPFVYPNPYYAKAGWEYDSNEELRKITFANLPAHCEVTVYTLAGDIVHSFVHTENSYTGSDSKWFSTYSDPTNTLFSGGEHAWNLLSTNIQILARGLYLFVVKDLESGRIKRGKFAIVK